MELGLFRARFAALALAFVSLALLRAAPAEEGTEPPPPTQPAVAVVAATVDEMLSYWRALGMGASVWQIDEEYRLIETADGYRAEFAIFTYDNDEFRLELAPVSLDLTPTQAEGAYDYQLTFAAAMPWRTAAGGAGTITVGEQHNYGHWSPDFAAASRFVIDLRQLAIIVAEAAEAEEQLLGEVGALEQLRFDSHFQRLDEQRWRSHLMLRLGGWQGREVDGSRLQLDQLIAEIDLGGNDFAALHQSNDRLRQLITDHEEQAPAPEALSAFFEALLDGLATFDTTGFWLSLNDLTVVDQGEQASGVEPQQTSLDDFELQLDYDATVAPALLVAALSGSGFATQEPNLGSAARLDAFQQRYRLRFSADERWSGHQQGFLSGLEMRGNDFSIRYGHTSSDGYFSGRGTLYGLRDEVIELAAHEPDSDAFKTRATSLFLALAGAVFPTTAETHSRTDGLAVYQDGQLVASADAFDITSQWRLLDEANRRLQMTVALQEIALPGLPLPPLLTPQGLRLSVGMEHIPPDLLSRLASAGQATAALDEAERQRYFTQQLLPWLLDSGLGFFIARSFINSEGARIDLDLQSQLTPEPPLFSRGAMNLRFENLPALVEAWGVRRDPSANVVLALLTAFSQRQQRADGTVIDRFALKLSPNGRIILNEQDITDLVRPGNINP